MVMVMVSYGEGHPTDRFGGISVQKAYNRLTYSVREISSRTFGYKKKSARIFGKAKAAHKFG